MYHEPRHAPMKTYQGIKMANELMGTRVDLNDCCCGKLGTLAATRPDISTQVRSRKQKESEQGTAALRAGDDAAKVKVLTFCPSCLQGLLRFANDGVVAEADCIVVEIANTSLAKTGCRPASSALTVAASSGYCCE